MHVWGEGGGVSGAYCLLNWCHSGPEKDSRSSIMAFAEMCEGIKRISWADKLLGKFIKGYSSLAAPLTALTKKIALKEAFILRPVLALLDFFLCG